ncbi:QacE family quaternary ammonium compound efflux SMR transporter [Marivivens niveibacter]|uniref:QacE family quaternary ammonium compound efflux SMR transporter n=1 Tax=Marivivens niveibacter TaxID=1930667 RepID=A0A251X2L4_9RHOB|nr:multidrug efflux SMR transporter [Marivivens niveibacter]OUD10927.1 QacE family quaternary ammonium compound efflux SMR transporter [Marivivens niveibacter]
MPTHVIALIFAIIAETIATSALKASEQFTKLGPTAIVVIGYAISFYLLAYAVRFMPVGIVYAIWSGLGIVLVAIIGWVWFKQMLDLPAIIGLAMILGGIVVINVFSGATSHH